MVIARDPIYEVMVYLRRTFKKLQIAAVAQTLWLSLDLAPFYSPSCFTR